MAVQRDWIVMIFRRDVGVHRDGLEHHLDPRVLRTRDREDVHAEARELLVAPVDPRAEHGIAPVLEQRLRRQAGVRAELVDAGTVQTRPAQDRVPPDLDVEARVAQVVRQRALSLDDAALSHGRVEEACVFDVGVAQIEAGDPRVEHPPRPLHLCARELRGASGHGERAGAPAGRERREREADAAPTCVA